MPVDRRKGLHSAEKLIRQGKLNAALSKLEEISERSPDDLLTLNRLGDLLARQGKNAEAIGYYTKIADQFANGGFLPKAIAILKKILRLDPQNADAMARLGGLYQQQKLFGEARSYMLRAADLSAKLQDYEKAREIVESLLEAHPDDLRARVKLAEIRSDGGDLAGAVCDLVHVGAKLVDSGEAEEAEKIYVRARELDPGAEAPIIGLANCHFALGRAEEGQALLDEVAGEGPSPDVAGALALRCETEGRRDEAMALLAGTLPLEISVETWQALFKVAVQRGDVDDLWARVDGLIEAHKASASVETLLGMFDALGEVEADGHIPALERMVRVSRDRGTAEERCEALQRLQTACAARSLNDRAAKVAKELSTLKAASSGPTGESVAHDLIDPDASGKDAPAEGPTSRPAPPRPSEIGADVEAPAIPLNRDDEEFVAGRLTQAEVLEKYELHGQAFEQLEEILARFPGHVGAQERRLEALRAIGDRSRLGVGLATRTGRAGGRTRGARAGPGSRAGAGGRAGAGAGTGPGACRGRQSAGRFRRCGRRDRSRHGRGHRGRDRAGRPGFQGSTHPDAR